MMWIHCYHFFKIQSNCCRDFSSLSAAYLLDSFWLQFSHLFYHPIFSVHQLPFYTGILHLIMQVKAIQEDHICLPIFLTCFSAWPVYVCVSVVKMHSLTTFQRCACFQRFNSKSTSTSPRKQMKRWQQWNSSSTIVQIKCFRSRNLYASQMLHLF